MFNQQSFDSEGSIRVSSTSMNTADATPFDLRSQTAQTHLFFDPVLVNNTKEPSNCVSGKLIYERKKPKDTVFPSGESTEVISKKTIKSGDSLELSLDTSETKALFQGLQKMYEVFADIGGIPHGSETYVPLDNAAKQLLDILKDDRATLQSINQDDCIGLIKELINLLAQGIDHVDIHHAFEDLELRSIQNIAEGVSIAQLKRVACEIEVNLLNANEQYWQSEVFEKYQWIIGQVFATPCTIFESKAYIGGKTITNQGGNLPDFLYQNKITRNLSIIEIKTPVTKILGRVYRNNCYSLSDELSGAVNQVLSYRQSLMRDFTQLHYSTHEDFEAFHPQCVVVIGNTKQFLNPDGSMNSIALATFETFRRNLSGVVIVTYDELLQRIKDFLLILDGSADLSHDCMINGDYKEAIQPYDGDIPF